MDKTYKHTQVGYFMIIIIGSIILFIIGVILTKGMNWILLGTLLILIICLILFGTLTVQINNDTLTWYFGPGFWHKQVSLKDIKNCEPVKNKWYYGWGIHFTPHGWLYNVSGFWAVQILLKNN